MTGPRQQSDEAFRRRHAEHRPHAEELGLVPLEAVLSTGELKRRPSRAPDHETENRALVTLAQALADSPRSVLQTLANIFLEVFKVDSAGISLLSKDEKSFFWPAIAGLWQAQIGGGTPRDFGPCGDVLDCNAPLLFKHPERRYPYFLPVMPLAEECLLVPFHVGGKAVGTLWLIAHDSRRQFDAEDLRLLQSLGRFASAAYQTVQSLDTALEHGQVARGLMEDAVRFGLNMETLNAELREGEARYRTVFDSIGDGFCIIEKVAGEADEPLDFRYVEVNPSFEVQSGISGVVGRTLRQVIPDEFAEWLLTFDAVLKTGEAIRFERGLVAQGRVLELHAFRVEYPTRHCVGVSFRDITERQRAEERLRRNRDTFLNLIETAPFGVYVVDSQFRMCQASAVSLNVFSSVQPLIGRDFEEIVRTVWTDPFASEALARFRHTLETGEPYVAPSTTELRKDIPDVESYDWKIHRITLPDGQFGVVCYFYDVTERKLAEDALREREAFTRSIINSSPDCIKVLDLEGNLLSIQSGQELLGIEDIQPFLNTSWIEFWEGEHRQAARAAVTSAAADEAARFVGFFRTFRGEPKWWDVAVSPISGVDGKPARLLSVSRDVTQRTHAALTLEFLASVSRDLAQWTSVDGMMQTIGANVAAHLQLSLCAFVEIDETAEQVVIKHEWHREDVPSVAGVHRLADFVGDEFIKVARAGDVIVVRDVVTDPRTDPEKFAALKITSFLCVPLIRDGQWRFALCLYKSVAYDWREDEIELTRELTARIWTRMESMRAEAALRESEQRYRTLFESMDEGFCTIEMIFDEHEKPVDWRFLEVNPAFATLTGVANAVGKRIRELAPDHEAYWFETYGKVALTGEAVRFVNQSKALGGRWFDLYAFKVGGPESRKVAVLFNNITERKKSEEALRQSEARFRALFDWGPIAMYSCDSAGVIQEYNRGAVKLWEREPKPGETDEQFRGSFKTYLSDGTFLPYAQTLMTRILKGQAPAANDMEVGLERLDGSRLTLVVNVVPLKNEWGEINGAITCFHDITERKRAEAAQRASEANFRATFENAAIGIVHVGLDNRWLRVNPAMCRLSGYSADELTGNTFADITHPDDVASTQAQMRRLLAGEMATFTLEKRYIHKAGHPVWVSLTASLLRDPAGQAQYYIGAIEDISEKKAALAELDRQQRFIERLTHVMPNTLHVFSLAEQRNLWVNRHLGATLGYSVQEIARMGQGFLRLVLHPDDVAPMAAHFDSLVATSDKEVLEFDYRVRDHAGEWRWLRHSDTVFRRDPEGRALELVGTATDVTDRKRIAVDLSAALAAAEAATRAKSDFLSSMSHELRSPLNTMLGFAQLIESGTPPPTPRQQESVDEILKAGWYLLELINEILDLTLIESGRLAFSLEPVSLAEVLSHCQSMVELQAQQDGIRLSFPQLDDACMVNVDRTRVKQIFINLLSNAIKYNRPGGTVSVSCAVQDESRIRISFEDTGAGLTPDQLDHLFEPFERLGRETGLIEGTGIGLVVSKRLVELMGGHIGVQSSVGLGSVFWVDLVTSGAFRPAHAEPGAPAVTGPRPAPAPGTQLSTVLCVEDNPANMMLMQRILARRTDLRLLLTSEGSHGLEVARATRPDVILMDINLPGISGLELLKLLSEDAATAHIPVIAISANALRHDVENGLRAGFFRFLTKPIKIDLFMEALDAALKLPPAGPTHTPTKAETS